MKTIHALRAFRALQQSVGPVLGDILRRTADTEARLARMDAGSARLEEAVSRLQASRAQVAVLADALGDVRTASRGVRAAIMRR